MFQLFYMLNFQESCTTLDIQLDLQNIYRHVVVKSNRRNNFFNTSTLYNTFLQITYSTFLFFVIKYLKP